MHTKFKALIATACLVSAYAGHRAIIYGQGLAEYYRGRVACAWVEPRVLDGNYRDGITMLSDLCWQNKLEKLGNSKEEIAMNRKGKSESQDVRDTRGLSKLSKTKHAKGV